MVLHLPNLFSDKWCMHIYTGILILDDLCFNIPATCIEGTVRLLAGNDYAYYLGEVNSDYSYTYIKDTLSRGRVQICIGGEYTRVCANLWDNQDASVVCRELGFSPYGEFAGIVSILLFSSLSCRFKNEFVTEQFALTIYDHLQCNRHN